MSELLTIIGIILVLAVAVIVIYLIGRVGVLESFINNRMATNSTTEKPEGGESTDKSYLGLEGQKLWDALTGSESSIKEKDLTAVRNRYSTLLKKHISLLFAAGLADGKSGTTKRQPKNPMVITTLRGSLRSWLPRQHVASLYGAGYESARADNIDIARIHSSLTETIDILYLRAGLTMELDFPQSLLPSTPSTSGFDELHEPEE